MAFNQNHSQSWFEEASQVWLNRADKEIKSSLKQVLSGVVMDRVLDLVLCKAHRQEWRAWTLGPDQALPRDWAKDGQKWGRGT